MEEKSQECDPTAIRKSLKEGLEMTEVCMRGMIGV